MTPDDLKILGREHANLNNDNHLAVNLMDLSQAQLTELRTAFVRLQQDNTRQMGPLITDIDRWAHILEEGTTGDERGRTLQQFADLLVQYILGSPGRRIYQQQPESGEWLTHYVNYVDYEREVRTRDGRYNPAVVTIHTLHWNLGKQRNDIFQLQNSDIDGLTIAEALARKDLLAETPELREQYLHHRIKFEQIYHQLGRQYTTTGYGTPIANRYSSRVRTPLMTEGIPAKVVVDLPEEIGETQEEIRTNLLRHHFWDSQRPRADRQENSENLSLNDDIIDGIKNPDQAPELPEIPVHPYVAVYHLNRHIRYRVHVQHLDEYNFDLNLSEQLILPQVTKHLIDTLVSQGRVSFEDIVAGKGGGACVLLGGPSGTGKTLTAEVIAEATKRPLLSIQAAQLGISPEDIEKKLAQVLFRASRWNAVVLLDEADVYISERGSNLEQNAIVAAFLRILENHTATLFMATNRIGNVDDAIASRCIARIDYTMPSPEEQAQIWQILNRLNDTGLSDDDIDKIIQRHNQLSGRDIKQILKLAALWANAQDQPLNTQSIDFVAGFIPTRQVSTDHAPNSLTG